ncbi:MAG: hypothetical protein PVG03_19280 [Desulfarculaceae bacterium]|jgi:hypothetical protein
MALGKFKKTSEIKPPDSHQVAGRIHLRAYTLLVLRRPDSSAGEFGVNVA